MLHQLIRLIADVPGNTAECGAYIGAGSFLIAQANAQVATPRTHYVFDSFEGLSRPVDLDGAYWHQGDLATPEAVLRQNLREFGERVIVHRGWIPQSFSAIDPQPFAFVHVDVDLHEPTAASLDFFYPLLSPGGIMVIDDYGSTHCPGATSAVDEFLADKPEKMIALSAGAGFFIKGVRTLPPLYPIPT
jgi:hypothetical protein